MGAAAAAAPAASASAAFFFFSMEGENPAHAVHGAGSDTKDTSTANTPHTVPNPDQDPCLA